MLRLRRARPPDGRLVSEPRQSCEPRRHGLAASVDREGGGVAAPPLGGVCGNRRTAAPRAPTGGQYHRPRDGPEPHPQLLDHRAHRPRQVDARRPHPRAHRGRLRRARCASSSSTRWTSSASAGITIKAQAVRVIVEGPRAQPDRHARARRLHLRGLALAPGVRGRAARRRRARRASRRRRSRTPTSRSRTASRSSRSRTRSTCPQADPDGAGRARSADLLGDDARPRRCASRRRRATASPTCSTRSSSGCPAPAGDPDAPRARARLRLLLRPVPRRRRLRPRRRRRRSRRREALRAMAHRHRASTPRSSASSRRRMTPVERAHAPARSATSSPG